MRVREHLVNMFGESAKGIQGFEDEHYNIESKQPSLVIRDNDGGLFVHCNGECLISFARVDGMRGRVYLVRNDSEASKWEVEQRGNNGYPTRHKPSPVLKLVYNTENEAWATIFSDAQEEGITLRPRP